jgi:hypothetical protein
LIRGMVDYCFPTIYYTDNYSLWGLLTPSRSKQFIALVKALPLYTWLKFMIKFSSHLVELRISLALPFWLWMSKEVVYDTIVLFSKNGNRR